MMHGHSNCKILYLPELQDTKSPVLMRQPTKLFARVAGVFYKVLRMSGSCVICLSCKIYKTTGYGSDGYSFELLLMGQWIEWHFEKTTPSGMCFLVHTAIVLHGESNNNSLPFSPSSDHSSS